MPAPRRYGPDRYRLYFPLIFHSNPWPHLPMDADILRIILAVLGALIIAGLYYWEQRRRQSREDEHAGEHADRDRMVLWGEDLDAETGADDSPRPEGHPSVWERDDQDLAADGAGTAQPAPARPSRGRAAPSSLDLVRPDPEFAGVAFPPGPMLVVLHVAARAPEGHFDGAAIVLAARIAGLEPGDREIFHCNLGDEHHTETLFSMANMVKPGTFPFGAMADFITPGLTLFAQLEGQPGDPGRLEELLGTAHSLARDLGGELLDERRQPLTSAWEDGLQKRVMAFVTQRMAEEEG